MGNLTEDIFRLCGEIETLRESRKVFGRFRGRIVARQYWSR